MTRTGALGFIRRIGVGLVGVATGQCEDPLLRRPAFGGADAVRSPSGDVSGVAVSAADTPEPAPREGTGDVWLEVVSAVGPYATISLAVDRLRIDMWGRWRFGLAKYGTPLQRDNGRDHYADAYQECLDLVVYLWAARSPWWLRWGAVAFAWAIRRRLP